MESKKHNVADVMKKFGLAKTTVLRWEKEGKIPNATRDQLGWRYWKEEDFQKVLGVIEEKISTPRVYLRTERLVQQSINSATPSLAVHSEIHTPPQIPIPKKIEIIPRDERGDIAIETFLPKLSKEREVVNKVKETGPEKKWLHDLDISDFRFGFASLVFLLAIFSYSTFGSGMIYRATEMARTFSSAFNHATEKVVTSGSFVASASSIDAKVFTSFNNLSSIFAERGLRTRSFISYSGEGLSEGVFALGGLADDNFLNFGSNILNIEGNVETRSRELEEFTRESKNSYQEVSFSLYKKFANIISDSSGALALYNKMFPALSSRLGEVEFYARLPNIEIKTPKFLSGSVQGILQGELGGDAEVFFNRLGGLIRVVFDETRNIIGSLIAEAPKETKDNVAVAPPAPKPVPAPAPAKPSSTKGVTIIDNSRVIERIIEREVSSTQQPASSLDGLRNELLEKIFSVEQALDQKIQNNFNTIAISQRINNLGGGTAPVNNIVVKDIEVTGACTGCGSSSSSSGSGTVGSGTLGQIPYYAAAGTTLTATSSIFLADSGYFGVGTTTPGSLFSIANVANFQTGTSTIYSGINLTTGCVAINGTCISSGGGGTPGGSDSQIQYNNGGAFGGTSGLVWDDTNLFLGVGSTTPGVKLSVTGSGVFTGLVTAPSFDATSTATSTFAGGINIATGGLTLGTLTSGSVPFIGTNGALIQNNSELFWDNANTRLGIGTNAPSDPLYVEGNVSIRETGGTGRGLQISPSTAGVTFSKLGASGGGAEFIFVSAVNTLPVFAIRGAASQSGDILQIQDPSGNPLSVFNSSGFLGIGTTTPGSSLSIQSVANFQAGTSTIYSGLTVPGLFASSSGITLGGGSFVQTNNATNTFGGGLRINTGGLTLATANCSGLSNGGALTTDSSGNVICSADDSGSGGDGAGNPFDITSIGGTLHSASSSRPFYFSQGLLAASSTLGYLNVGFITSTSTATSTFAGGLSAAGLLSSNGLTITGGSLLNTSTATSTFTNGIVLSGGCFYVNGSCISAGAGSSPGGSDSQIQYNNGGAFGGATGFVWDDVNLRLGVGTTSPTSLFSVQGNTWLDSMNINLASTSASTLTVSYNTSATSTIKNNSLYAWTLATSTTARPIFRIDTGLTGTGANNIATTSIYGSFLLDDGAFAYDSATGTVSIDSLNTGPMAFDTDSGVLSWIDMNSATTTVGRYNSYSAMMDSTPVLTVFATTTSSGTISKGNVGIGTTTPQWTLTVVGGICISTGSTCPAAEVNGGLRVDTAGVAGGDDPGDVFDVAERYPASEPVSAGEIVAIDSATSSRAMVKKALVGDVAIGIVSTRPALAINGSEVILGASQEGTSTRPLVALTGRVPVKVNLEGGEIKKGDKITLSSVAGVGMKATTSSYTVGIALENQDQVGEVLVYVNLGWSNLDPEIFTFASSTQKIKANYAVDMNDEDILNARAILSSSGKWSIDENGKLTVDEIQTKKLCLEDVCITKDELRNLLDQAGSASVINSQPSPAPTPPPPPADLPAEAPAEEGSPPDNQAGEEPEPIEEPEESPPAPEPPPTPEATQPSSETSAGAAEDTAEPAELPQENDTE